MPGSSSIDLLKSITKDQTDIGRPVRPRSVYTAYPYVDAGENRSQRFAEQHKVYDILPPSEQWMPSPTTSPPITISHSALAQLWRQQARNAKRLQPSCYLSDQGYMENWREPDADVGIGAAVATPHGTISLWLRERVRIDMTVDQAIRIINPKNNIVLTLSSSGSTSSLIHPNGRVYQYGSRVEIMANDPHGNNKYAKMWYKGVSFTSEKCALVYLVDSGGTRSTADNFLQMTQDFSVSVFYTGSRHGPNCSQEVISVLQNGQYWMTDDLTQNWIINGIRISQTRDGLVRVACNNNKYQLRTSPSNGNASLSTPFVHCTASMGQTSHLFVRRGERRMHYDGSSFIVRNAGHSAGFDEKNQLKVY